MRIRASWTLATALLLPLTACDALLGGKDEGGNEPKPKEEPKAETKEPTEASLEVAAGDPPVDGPVPPETSAVFFAVEGALYPLACFDKDKKALVPGSDCLDSVGEGAEVRLSSIDAEYNRLAKARVEPQCLAGSGKKVAIDVEGIKSGAQFKFGTWPRSVMKIVKTVDEDSTSPAETQLDDDEIEAIKKAIGAKAQREGLELEAHQVAELHIDDDGDKDKVYSVYIPDPKVTEQYVWSGAFLAMGGDLANLTLLETSKTKRDVFEIRGTLDLDGDKQNELWMRLVFEEGGGDRIVDLVDGKPKPIGDWSCGA